MRRVLLVGFMGSGKSTVGPLLAGAMSWRFEDFDSHVERSEGRSIPDIFREDGEPYFRKVEGEAATSLLALDEVVLASGGGWAAVPGRLRAVPDGTVSIWLRVTPEVALARAGGGTDRPVLDHPDRLGRARELLSTRTVSYAEADLEVDTDGRTPEDVCESILALIRASSEHIRG